MPRNRALDLQHAQAGALEHAREWLSHNSLHLPEDLTEEVFNAVMEAVTRGLVTSYASGYLAATEGKHRS